MPARTNRTKAAQMAAAALLLGVAAAAAAPLAMAAVPSVIAFAIKRGDSTIGHHSVTLWRDGAALHAEVDIDVEVSLGPIPVFSFHHESRELWQDGRLISLESRTDDDGDHYLVTAQATADGLAVDGPDGRFLVPADILPTSYWHPDTIRQTRMLDTQHGRLVDVTIRAAGAEVVAIRGGSIQAQRYDMAGDLKGTLWYGPDGEWVKTSFEARGEKVQYARQTARLAEQDVLSLAAGR